MEIILESSMKKCMDKESGVGLGNFDGLHLGHMKLIDTLITESRKMGIESILYTFSKHPENILRKKLFTPLLTTVTKKVELLGRTSLDHIYFDEFDENFSRLKPISFVEEILVKKLKIRLAVTGTDYRFGYKGQGDVELLSHLGKVYGFRVITIPPVTIDNETVSSTGIRKNILSGNVHKASRLLGRNYSIAGKVVHGRQIGNKIGFPTANIIPEDYLTIPHSGVYITKTLLDGKIINSVTNIGNNPTFKDVEKTSIETHLLDIDQEIYGSNIEVFFLTKIRSEKEFGSVEELIIQIKKDVQFAREYFNIS